MTDKRPLAALGTFLLLNLCIVIFLRDTIPAITHLYPDPAVSGAWFVPQHFWQLYLLTPLVVTASIITLLAPGLLIVVAGKWADSPGELMLQGFGLSYVLHFLTTSAAKTVSGGPLDSSHFLLLLSATLAITYGYLVLRARKAGAVFRMFADPCNRAQLYWLFAIPFIFIIALLPVLFWQDLNADGFEAMEIGRTLSTAILPVFPTAAGTMGLGIGMVPMAYPIHWFIMLFGPIEAATRLPMVLYSVVVFAALLAFIEYQAPRRMRVYEQAALLAGIAGYVAAMSFNSGYDNYFTDMSSPPAFETLTILLILGSSFFLWTGRRGWFLLFTVLGFLARPTMLLVVVLLGIGIRTAAHERRRSSLVMIGTAIAVWIGLLLGYEHLFLPTLSGGLGPDYAGAGILNRFHYLTFTDLHRLLYAAAPVGILPALALFAYRYQDPLSRCITIVSAGYFLVFYIPAFTSLHHFVPVMILPLIVLWRLILFRTNNYWPALATGTSAVLFIWLSLPQHFEISRVFRDIGSSTTYLVGNYQGNFDAYRQAILGAGSLNAFFAPEWKVADTATELVGGYQQLYYARHTGQPAADTNYLVLSAGSAAPDGFSLLDSDATTSSWVKDPAQWDADRYHPPGTGYRSQLYEISRETSFYFLGIPAHNYDVNLGSFPLLWRIFPGS